MKILVIFTGGTIGSVAAGGTIDTDSGTAFKLIELFREQQPNQTHIEFDTLQPIQILSENMAPAAWKTIVAAIEAAEPGQYDGIVVTHGTDTLAYTACALSFYFNALAKPLLMVSSDYPLDHPLANGLHNFICAVEYIRQIGRPGVFVPYRNQRQTMQLHAGTRLACSLQLGGDFFSVQGKSHMQYEDGRFTLLTPRAPAASVPLQAEFSERVSMIKPYPGLDYRNINLDGVEAVLHDLYHSGTACATMQWGENRSLSAFIERCANQGVAVYLAPAIKSADAYQSTRALIEQGAKVVWNMSIEAAYVKLLLAYGNFSGEREIMDFVETDIAGEHI